MLRMLRVTSSTPALTLSASSLAGLSRSGALDCSLACGAAPTIALRRRASLACLQARTLEPMRARVCFPPWLAFDECAGYLQLRVLPSIWSVGQFISCGTLPRALYKPRRLRIWCATARRWDQHPRSQWDVHRPTPCEPTSQTATWQFPWGTPATPLRTLVSSRGRGGTPLLVSCGSHLRTGIR